MRTSGYVVLMVIALPRQYKPCSTFLSLLIPGAFQHAILGIIWCERACCVVCRLRKPGPGCSKPTRAYLELLAVALLIMGDKLLWWILRVSRHMPLATG